MKNSFEGGESEQNWKQDQFVGYGNIKCQRHVRFFVNHWKLRSDVYDMVLVSKVQIASLEIYIINLHEIE